MPANRARIALDGQEYTIAELARKHGLTRETLSYRIRRQMPLAEALARPVRRRGKRGGRHPAKAPRPVPSLKQHPSGRAYVRWKAGGGVHERYFGKYGTDEASARYRGFAAEWVAGPVEDSATLTVGGLADMWLAWAEKEYVKGGKRTSSYAQCCSARDALTELYGAAPVAQFGPKAYRAVRGQLVDRGLSRTTVEKYCYRARQCFGWGVGMELVPASVASALDHVEGLKPGRTAAAEPVPRGAADDHAVTATLPHLSPLVADMVRFQQLTGCRPGEVCAMTPADLDRTGAVWLYTVAMGKSHHTGKPTLRWIGPRARAVLDPHLKGKRPGACVFGIGRNMYTRHVGYACAAAGVSPWTPHQLRHAKATAIAKATGSAQAAADAIGDTLAVATRHYVHCDPREAERRKLADQFG